MAEVIDFKTKAKTEEPSLKQTLKEAVEQLSDNIDGVIILVMNKDGQACSGYFNTDFRTEATLAKVLELDIIHRQTAREALPDGE